MRHLLLALLAVLALAGCGSESASAPEETATHGTEPSVSGTGLGGEPISLADFHGKPVFVNVWSSW